MGLFVCHGGECFADGEADAGVRLECGDDDIFKGSGEGAGKLGTRQTMVVMKVSYERPSYGMKPMLMKSCS